MSIWCWFTEDWVSAGSVSGDTQMKRRIVLISQHASPLAQPGEEDSGEAYVARVAYQLAWLGIQVEIFTCEVCRELREVCGWRENIRILHVPVSSEASQTDRLHALREYMQEFFSQEHTPDLIHATSWQSGQVAAELKTDLGIPFVVSDEPSTAGFPGENLEPDQRVIRQADAILVSSARERENVVNWYEADPTYIVEVQQGFDTENAPGQMYTSQGEHLWQRLGRQLAELYEDVLAVRRVMIPSLRTPVLTAGQYGHQNEPQGVQQALEAGEMSTALQIPVNIFCNEAGMLSMPLARIG
jgi:hypothetical protein